MSATSIKKFIRPIARAAALAAAMGIGSATANAANIMAMGDSITYGSRSEATGGYLQSLQNLLPNNFNFIGPQQTLIPPADTTPYPDSWNHHFGIPGIQADAVGSSLITQATSQNLFASYSPDALLLHIGTNTIDIDNASADDARDQLDRLLDYLGQNLPSHTQVIVAQVIPKANRNSGDTGISKPTVWQTRRYNDHVASLISGLSNADPLFGRIHTVDMFRIDLSDASLGLTHLLTDTDVNTDGDNFVDWILDFNEQPWGGDPGVNRDQNSNLLADALHPTALGYEIMANVWYKALLDTNVVPEPTTAGLLALGSLALLRRRRRIT